MGKQASSDRWRGVSRKRIKLDKKTGLWKLFQEKTSFLYDRITIHGPSTLLAKSSQTFTPRIETNAEVEGVPSRRKNTKIK